MRNAPSGHLFLQLVGTFPEEIGMFHELQDLFVAGNWKLTGTVPQSVQSLQNLERVVSPTIFIIVHNHQRTNDIFKTYIFSLPGTTSLIWLPFWHIFELPCLTLQVISHSRLHGTIPLFLESADSLNNLIASSSDFHRIPDDIGKLPNLVVLVRVPLFLLPNFQYATFVILHLSLIVGLLLFHHPFHI